MVDMELKFSMNSLLRVERYQRSLHRFVSFAMFVLILRHDLSHSWHALIEPYPATMANLIPRKQERGLDSTRRTGCRVQARRWRGSNRRVPDGTGAIFTLGMSRHRPGRF